MKSYKYKRRSGSVVMRVNPQFKNFMDSYKVFLSVQLGDKEITDSKASLKLYRAIRTGKNPYDLDLF